MCCFPEAQKKNGKIDIRIIKIAFTCSRLWEMFDHGTFLVRGGYYPTVKILVLRKNGG